MKILLPADGSACSLRAVDQLIAHIDCLREVPEIHLLHVHLPIPIGRVQAHVGETLHAYYLEEGSSNCRQRSRKLDAAGRFHTTHIHVGQPAEVIGKMAAELDCDLIVMGTHGRGPVAGLVMVGGDARVASCGLPGVVWSNERG